MNNNFNHYQQLESTEMYLCSPNLTPMFTINGQDVHFILRFNDLSELTFTVTKDAGISEVDYNKITTKRLVFVENRSS